MFLNLKKTFEFLVEIGLGSWAHNCYWKRCQTSSGEVHVQYVLFTVFGRTYTLDKT